MGMLCFCTSTPKVVDEPPHQPVVHQPATQPSPFDGTAAAATTCTAKKPAQEDLLGTEDSWNTSQTLPSPSDGEGCTSSHQWTNADQVFMPTNADMGWEPCTAGSLAGRHPSDYTTNPLLGNTRYKKLRDLGAGTYGFVLLAHDTKHGDLCAVKCLEVWVRGVVGWELCLGSVSCQQVDPG